VVNFKNATAALAGFNALAGAHSLALVFDQHSPSPGTGWKAVGIPDRPILSRLDRGSCGLSLDNSREVRVPSSTRTRNGLEDFTHTTGELATVLENEM
jgi:hypothetical protein